MADQKEPTAGKPLRALMVEDSENDAAFLVRALSGAGYALAFERVQTAQTMRAALENRGWDIVFSDHDMPGFSSQGALKTLGYRNFKRPFSRRLNVSDACQAVKRARHHVKPMVRSTSLTILWPNAPDFLLIGAFARASVERLSER